MTRRPWTAAERAEADYARLRTLKDAAEAHISDATMSLCCKIARIGWHPPEVMHSGLCREAHGGVLGPTIYLVDQTRIRELEAERDALRALLREMRLVHRNLWELSPEGRTLLARYDAALAGEKPC